MPSAAANGAISISWSTRIRTFRPGRGRSYRRRPVCAALPRRRAGAVRDRARRPRSSGDRLSPAINRRSTAGCGSTAGGGRGGTRSRARIVDANSNDPGVALALAGSNGRWSSRRSAARPNAARCGTLRSVEPAQHSGGDGERARRLPAGDPLRRAARPAPRSFGAVFDAGAPLCQSSLRPATVPSCWRRR